MNPSPLLTRTLALLLLLSAVQAFLMASRSSASPEHCSCSGACTATLAKHAERYDGTIAGSDVLTGKGEEFSIQSQKFTVIAFLSARCPCSASHEVELSRLHKEYASQGVKFIGIHSNVDEPAELTAQHFGNSNLPFAVLQDRESQLANTLGALKTPHVYLLNQTGEALYQGGVDDSNLHENSKRHYLRDALAAVTAGKEPPVKESRTLGCVIKR